MRATGPAPLWVKGLRFVMYRAAFCVKRCIIPYFPASLLAQCPLSLAVTDNGHAETAAWAFINIQHPVRKIASDVFSRSSNLKSWIVKALWIGADMATMRFIQTNNDFLIASKYSGLTSKPKVKGPMPRRHAFRVRTLKSISTYYRCPISEMWPVSEITGLWAHCLHYFSPQKLRRILGLYITQNIKF